MTNLVLTLICRYSVMEASFRISGLRCGQSGPTYSLALPRSSGTQLTVSLHSKSWCHSEPLQRLYGGPIQHLSNSTIWTSHIQWPLSPQPFSLPLQGLIHHINSTTVLLPSILLFFSLFLSFLSSLPSFLPFFFFLSFLNPHPTMFFKQCFLKLIFKKRQAEGEIERETLMWKRNISWLLPVCAPQLRTKSAT